MSKPACTLHTAHTGLGTHVSSSSLLSSSLVSDASSVASQMGAWKMGSYWWLGDKVGRVLCQAPLPP